MANVTCAKPFLFLFRLYVANATAQQQAAAVPPTIDEEIGNVPTGNGDVATHHAPMLQVNFEVFYNIFFHFYIKKSQFIRFQFLFARQLTI